MTDRPPAWGTPPGPQTAKPTTYTVVGFYAANGQRFRFDVVALNPREAEDMARSGGACEPEGDPQVCGVLAVTDGQIRCVDTYAFYLDPDAPAPAQ